MQTALAEWERPICAVCLILAGALLTLPTVWILAAVPVLGALRVGARWAGARYARVALRLRDVPPHSGLGTVAQGGTALALGINYFLMYGGGPDAPGRGIGGTGGAGTGQARCSRPSCWASPWRSSRRRPCCSSRRGQRPRR